MRYSIPTIVATGADTELQEMARDEGAFANLPKTFDGEGCQKVIELRLRFGAQIVAGFALPPDTFTEFVVFDTRSNDPRSSVGMHIVFTV